MGNISMVGKFCTDITSLQITDKDGTPIYRSVLDIWNGFGECINFIHVLDDVVTLGMSSGKFDPYGSIIDAYLVIVRNPRFSISNRSSHFSSVEVTDEYSMMTSLLFPMALILLTRKKISKLV